MKKSKLKSFVKNCKMMQNIIISNLHRFLDFYLNREGQNWPFYDSIKIGKIVKQIAIYSSPYRPRRAAERKEFSKKRKE